MTNLEHFLILPWSENSNVSEHVKNLINSNELSIIKMSSYEIMKSIILKYDYHELLPHVYSVGF